LILTFFVEKNEKTIIFLKVLGFWATK